MKILATFLSIFLLVFTAKSQSVLVNSPSGIAGSYSFTASFCSGWGADISAGVWTADAVFVDDGVDPVTNGCTDPVNNISGKIALIDRGICLFSLKALKAQTAGAVAVIIFNNIPGGGVVNMAASTHGDMVTIPVVMLTYEAGQTIRTTMMTETVNISIGGSGSDDDCDGVLNICDLCPGGDDSGPCYAQSFPGFENVPADWACGNNNKKIKICHNGNTLCVSTNSLPDHLGHGDFLGPCKSCAQNISSPAGNVGIQAADGLELQIFPNPTDGKVTVQLVGIAESEAQLTVFDQLGRVVFAREIVEADQTFQLQLEQLPPGSYFVKVTSGKENLTRKLMIAR